MLGTVFLLLVLHTPSIFRKRQRAVIGDDSDEEPAKKTRSDDEDMDGKWSSTKTLNEVSFTVLLTPVTGRELLARYSLYTVMEATKSCRRYWTLLYKKFNFFYCQRWQHCRLCGQSFMGMTFLLLSTSTQRLTINLCMVSLTYGESRVTFLNLLPGPPIFAT